MPALRTLLAANAAALLGAAILVSGALAQQTPAPSPTTDPATTTGPGKPPIKPLRRCSHEEATS
jgi:hypothetical protein